MSAQVINVGIYDILIKRLFKDNKIICQGREVGFPIKNQVCVLDNVYKCVSCEMIKDDCLCA